MNGRAVAEKDASYITNLNRNPPEGHTRQYSHFIVAQTKAQSVI